MVRSSIVGSLTVVVLCVALIIPLRVRAFDVPPNDGFVTDVADILTSQQKQALEQRLAAYRQSTSNEIAIVLLKDLQGTSIEDAGLTIGRKWGVGSTENNGILLLVSSDDRLARIEVGYGLEGAVPDIVAKGIIDTDLIPAFRSGRYYDGIDAAITSLQKHIGGEYTADRYAQPAASGGVLPYVIFFGFILLQWLLSVMGRSKSWWLGGVFGGIAGLILSLLFGWWLTIPILIPIGLLLDYVVSKNYRRRGSSKWWLGGGWWGGGGFGGGSGGFGGFGGGNFGVGGASGRW